MYRHFSYQRWPLVAAVTLCAAALAFGVGLALRGSSDALPTLPSPPHARRDLSVAWNIGPTLRELRSHFAVFRRPATPREHAMLPTFTAPTHNQPEVPEYVRQAGVVNGIHVYFVVYPIFRHETSGPVVAYKMNVIAGGGYGWQPGDYLVFPTVIASVSQTGTPGPQAYMSVVPDGVRYVRWHFTCPHASADGTSCELPAQRVVTVPVHGNLATLPITSYSSLLPTVNRVTWYRTNGSQSTFTDPNTAIPFPGAPAWRVK